MENPFKKILLLRSKKRKEDDTAPLMRTNPLTISKSSAIHNLFGHPIADFSSIYTIKKSLDTTINLVTDKSGNTFACKTLNIRPANIRREVEIMYHLDGHPNIISLVNVIEDVNLSTHILMEHGDGNLVEMIEKRRSLVKWPLKNKKIPSFLEKVPSFLEKKPFTENEAREVFRQIANAINYCHEMGVMHRDIKLENFVFFNKKGGSQMKLIDFGLSTFFKPAGGFRSPVGSLPYIAPEVIEAETNNEPYGPKADVWSTGMILYTLLSGDLPFASETLDDLKRVIKQRDYRRFDTKPAWLKISSNARNLVTRMLEENVGDRISAAEILMHPWLKEPDDLVPDTTIVARLMRFYEKSYFTRVAIMVSAESLFEEETRGLRNMYESMAWDCQRTDEVSFEEMKNGLTRWGHWGVDDHEMKRILTAVDVNGNKMISSAEFIAATVHRNRLFRKGFLEEAFKRFDRGNKGYMTMDDLQRVLHQYNMIPTKEDDVTEEVFGYLRRERCYYSEFEFLIKISFMFEGRAADSQYTNKLTKHR